MPVSSQTYTGFVRYELPDFGGDTDTMRYINNKKFTVTGTYCPSSTVWYVTAVDLASQDNFVLHYTWKGSAKVYNMNEHDKMHTISHITGTISNGGLPIKGYYAGGTTKVTTNQSCDIIFTNQVG